MLLLVRRRRVSELRNDAVHPAHVERSNVHLMVMRILLLLSSERELVVRGRILLLVVMLSVGEVGLSDSSSFSVEVELVPEVCSLSVKHRLSLLESEAVLERRGTLREASELGRRTSDG